MGLIPVLNTAFGLIFLFGRGVWLHVPLAAGPACFGFTHRGTDMDAATV